MRAPRCAISAYRLAVDGVERRYLDGTYLADNPEWDRRKVGHLHFYTKDLALETLRECGYHIVEARYTGAYAVGARRSLRTIFAALPRRIAYALHKDAGVRLLGGETLLVLAQAGAPEGRTQ